MTKVTTAAGAFAFDPAVPLSLQRDPIRFDRLPERRPSGPAVVLPGRGEEGRAAASAQVHTRCLLVVEGRRPRRLGEFQLEHRECEWIPRPHPPYSFDDVRVVLRGAQRIAT